MAFADVEFIKLCERILSEGTWNKHTDYPVRSKWADGEPAYTKHIFGVSTAYDVGHEFPALTLRPTYIKSAINEVLWIYQKKSNNIHDLNSHIWDQWADDDGFIGRAYGYQVAQERIHHVENYDYDQMMEYADRVYHGEELTNGITKEFVDNIKATIEQLKKEAEERGEVLDTSKLNFVRNVTMDQMDCVLYDLKTNPFSRRMVISLWNPQDLIYMNLSPCCWSLTFSVTAPDPNRMVLNLHLNQRSADILVANNWNVVQYAALLKMVAKVSDMEVGTLYHSITDAHIYDRHIPLVEKLITREAYDAPTVTLNPLRFVKSFYDFREEDFAISNYKTGEQIKNIEVAI